MDDQKLAETLALMHKQLAMIATHLETLARLVQLLKDAGTTKSEATAALGIAGSVVMASEEIPILSQDERERIQPESQLFP